MRDQLEAILAERPPLQSDFAGGWSNWSVDNDVARFLFDTTGARSRTLETGSGLSTVVLSLRGTRHVAIAPWRDDLSAVERYCRGRGISLARTRLVRGRSEEVLPRMRRTPLDLVLIDGRHAFPSPIIDWFYTADRLVTGGLMVVDDLQLPSCALLADFLEQEEGWDSDRALGSVTRVFRKLRPNATLGEWTRQRWRFPKA